MVLNVCQDHRISHKQCLLSLLDDAVDIKVLDCRWETDHHNSLIVIVTLWSGKSAILDPEV